jgi:tetratricopeptide (TPR) repeat protein
VLLKKLTEEYPAVPEYKHFLACCYRDAPRQRPPEEPGSRRAEEEPIELVLLRELVKEFPKVPDYRYDLSETLARLAYFGRPREPGSNAAERMLKAEKMLEEAVKLSSGLSADYPNVPLYIASQAVAQEKLGLVLQQRKQPASAEKALRKAVALQAKLAGKHPEVVAYRFSQSLMESSLARFLSDDEKPKEKWNEARTLLESSARRLEELLQKDQSLRFARMSLGQNYQELAQVLIRLDARTLAAEAQRKAESFAPDRGPDHFGPREPRRQRP